MTDAYAHCGLRKYKPVETVRARMAENGVDRTVLVQHRGEFDHSYIEDIVRREPQRFAGAFLVDTENPRAAEEVTRWSERGILRGIRMAAPTLSTHRALWAWAAQLGLHFIVDGGPLQQSHVLSGFAGDFPRTQFVLTHLAGPDIANWRSHRPAVARLSACANVHVQISGMHSLADPPYTALLPWIGLLREHFGSRRLLYGSNYPAMKDESAYSLEWRLAREGKLGIAAADLPAVLNDNAVRLWFSPQPRRK